MAEIPSDAARQRLDTELVRRGLARSRSHATRLVEAGVVLVGGRPARRASAPVGPGQDVVVEEHDDLASRAAHKLLGALAALGPAGLTVAGRQCLDAGASTGGFTDVLLRQGAARVVAVDVGTGQLDPRIAAEPRVEVRDGTNVRSLLPGDVDPAPELVVADLSFISLTLVLPALVGVAAPDADLLLMVKPQFEVGRDRIGARGIVKSPQLRAQAVVGVLDRARGLGLGVHGVTPSVLPGPGGNHEYFVWLSAPPAQGAAPRGRPELAANRTGSTVEAVVRAELPPVEGLPRSGR